MRYFRHGVRKDTWRNAEPGLDTTATRGQGVIRKTSLARGLCRAQEQKLIPTRTDYNLVFICPTTLRPATYDLNGKTLTPDCEGRQRQPRHSCAGLRGNVWRRLIKTYSAISEDKRNCYPQREAIGTCRCGAAIYENRKTLCSDRTQL